MIGARRRAPAASVSVRSDSVFIECSFLWSDWLHRRWSVGASRSHRRQLVALLLRSRRGSRRPRRRAGRRGSGRRPTGVACRAARRERPRGRRLRSIAIGSVGAVGDGVSRHRAPGAGASDIDRSAMGDRHEPCLDVGVVGQRRIRLHRRKERLRPGVVGLGSSYDGQADSQHGRAVHLDNGLERQLARHAWSTLRGRPERGLGVERSSHAP